MNNRFLDFCLMLAITLVLYGCGGGGGSSAGSGPAPIPATAASVTADLQTTNLNSASFPWNNIADGTLKRWSYETKLIPVKLNGSSQATYAVDLIETTLGKTIFDRVSIANTADSSITSGLIVSMGTAVGPGGVVNSTTCGTVSSAPSSPNISGNIIDATGTINAKLYVNIGSSGCAAQNNISVHEFAHAIGLGAHFSGYGTGDVIGGNFWNVLKTIYSNPVGATLAAITVVTGDGTTSSGGSTIPFTTAMLSGKTFAYSDTLANSGSVTFNANGTSTGIPGTWTIDSSERLVLNVTSSGNIATFTLHSATATTLIASQSVSNGTNATVTFTQTSP